MVRLNGGIALPTNSSENEGRRNGGLKISFFGMVGIVMAALSLKERWDSCECLLALSSSSRF